MVDSRIDTSFNDGYLLKMEEIAVQYCEGDKIVKERFYYNMPGQNTLINFNYDGPVSFAYRFFYIFVALNFQIIKFLILF